MSGMQQGNQNFVLEVIACSVEDAVNAELGGACRLEVIRGFEHGGFTPSLELVSEIRQRVSLPIRVMLREEQGYGLSEIIAVERLCCLSNEFNKMGVDGVVLGFLRGGEIDLELTQKFLACAPDLKATFHHAFEDSSDKIAAIERLKSVRQIDKILAHGGPGDRLERTQRLGEYARAAGPEISILAGGGIDIPMIESLREDTPIREFHVGRAARTDGIVDPKKVEALANAVRGIYAD